MQQVMQQIHAKQSEGAVNRQHRKIERIRARSSYILFQELYDFLENKPAIVNILRKFYDILDGRYSFGSRKNAEYAEESLDRVLKDKGVYKCCL
ncbi:MAG: hypothetical protein ACYSR9_00230 [Planctomycetota bacterium]|jgi:hypothetical protein